MRIWPTACLILILAAAAPAIAASATPAAGPAPTAADQKFKALYEREWAWRMKEFPGDDSEDTIPDRLPRVDAATQDQRLN